MHHCSIDDALHDRGLKKTHPRHRIIELFHEPRVWSARTLQAKLHDVGRATVYRNLRTLMQEHVITPVAGYDGEESYELQTTVHHDHVTCKKCHAVECLPCPIPNMNEHTLQLNGLCSTCTV